MKIVKLTVILIAMMTLLAVMPAAMGHNYIDVKPGSCPNSININRGGVLPVAILGGEFLNVTDINLSEPIELGFYKQTGPGVFELVYVPYLRYSFEDVAGPVIVPDSEYPCCGTPGPDGLMDLSLKFNMTELVAAGLSADLPEDKQKVEVRFTALNTTSGQEEIIRSQWDCIRLMDKGGGPDASPAQANNKKMK
ncbi:hypothetical protein [Methanococcoides sp. AM1]|uniref:hypothetical protein n=1 Tax=Methanococcoides sp. AM1 TaxID=1201011 RepID=UPI001082508B|nr:hypothetical protein [Methanococcoides sp. AM1]